METETLQIRIPQAINYRSSDNILSGFDLPGLISAMKKSTTWADGDLYSVVLLNSPEKKVILTGVHEGTEIESFQANDSISFRIIEGHLKFHLRNRTITVREGQLMKLDENIKYRLVAREDSVFLLIISNGLDRASN